MVTHFRELRIYRKAFRAAREIFRLSKNWPTEERDALIDQIRRSSRSVAANIAEAWRKRRYERHFVSKLSDADMEAGETRSWLDFALDCGYLSETDYETLDQAYEEITGGFVKMMTNPKQWCGPASLVREDEVAYEAATPTPPPAHTPTLR